MILPSLSVVQRLKCRCISQCPHDTVSGRLRWLQQVLMTSIYCKLQWWQINTSVLTSFRKRFAWLLYMIWYISRFMKKTDYKVTFLNPSPALYRVRCGFESEWLISVWSHSNQYPWGNESRHQASLRFVQIGTHWPFHQHDQHSAETSEVCHLNRNIIRHQQPGCPLSTISHSVTQWEVTAKP